MKSTKVKKKISTSAGARSYIRRLRNAGFTGKTIEHYEDSATQVFGIIDGDHLGGALYINLKTKKYTLSRYRVTDYERFKGNELSYGDFENILNNNKTQNIYEIY